MKMSDRKLRKLGACEFARQQITKEFPGVRSVELTADWCEANALKLTWSHWWWAASHLLPGYLYVIWKEAYDDLRKDERYIANTKWAALEKDYPNVGDLRYAAIKELDRERARRDDALKVRLARKFGRLAESVK